MQPEVPHVGRVVGLDIFTKDTDGPAMGSNSSNFIRSSFLEVLARQISGQELIYIITLPIITPKENSRTVTMYSKVVKHNLCI